MGVKNSPMLRVSHQHLSMDVKDLTGKKHLQGRRLQKFPSAHAPLTSEVFA